MQLVKAANSKEDFVVLSHKTTYKNLCDYLINKSSDDNPKIFLERRNA